MKKRDNILYAFEKMKKAETNDFIYRKWVSVGGLDNFRRDVGKCPSKNYILAKADELLPFSPTNFKWILKPPVDISSRLKVYKQKEVYDCFTFGYVRKDSNNSHPLKKSKAN